VLEKISSRRSGGGVKKRKMHATVFMIVLRLKKKEKPAWVSRTTDQLSGYYPWGDTKIETDKGYNARLCDSRKAA